MAIKPDSDQDDPQQEGVSLDELAQAFAQVMGTAPKVKRPKPASEEPQPVVAAPDPAQSPEISTSEATSSSSEPPADSDDSCPVNPRSILEAMLFVGDRDGSPLTAARMAELMRGVEASEIPALVKELNDRYAANGCPYYVAGDSNGYRLTLQKAFHSLRDQFYGRIREARLSQAAVDILAIVAYQQPVTADQIATLRGKPSAHVLSQLVHRGLLRIERQPGKQRVVNYFTTDRFLQLFGLQTLADLPQSEELDRQ